MAGASRFGGGFGPVRWRWFHWRGSLLIVTVLLGLIGFASGVGTTERPALASAGFGPTLYYTLGLFIFGGMDLGTPAGGPAWGRAVMWFVYFTAPAITASALVEAVLRMINADGLMFRRLDGHIVVAGCGRLTSLFLQRLRAADSERAVVVVGGADEAGTFDDLRAIYRAQVIEGDITSDAILGRLRLPYAARVLILTDDDFTNLDAASRILDRVPELACHVVVHLSDLRFMRSLERTRLARRCHVFNGHQIAASHLVHAHLLDHFHSTEPLDMVVLAGFGRFGQTVLDELQSAARGVFDRVVVVDLEGTRRAAIFAEQIGFGPGYSVEVVDGDLRDPKVWQEIEGRVGLSQAEPVFVVGSGADRTNLRIGLQLAARYPKAFVIARSDRQWAFADALSDEAGVRVVSVAKLVTESMPAAWLGPRSGAEFVAEPASTTMVMRRAELDAVVDEYS